MYSPPYTRWLFPAFIGMIFLPCCTTTRSISIQVLSPPDTVLLQHTHSATLIVRDHLISPKDSLFSVVPDSLLENREFLKDLSRECRSGLRDLLESSPHFERVEVDTLFHFPAPDTEKIFIEYISQDNLQELFAGYQTDVLISLDGIFAWDTLISTMVFNYIDGGPDGEWHIYRSLLIGLGAQWTIYHREKNRVVERYFYTDTVAWSYPEQMIAEGEMAFPEPGEAFREAFYWAGDGYGRRIASYWTETDRFYYCTINALMKQACADAENNDWRSAAAIWKELATGKDKNLAAKAAFNMALVCEIEDRLELAREWAISSFYLVKSRTTKEYVDVLSARIYMNKKLSSLQEYP